MEGNCELYKEERSALKEERRKTDECGAEKYWYTG